MKEKYIICKSCGRIIEKKEDLVTSINFIFVEPYHSKCFSRDLKSVKTVFLSNTPINGFMGNVSAVFAAILSFGLFFDSNTRIIGLFLLIPVVLRLISYIEYERHLK